LSLSLIIYVMLSDVNPHYLYLWDILIRTGQPSDTRRTYQTEYGWISNMEQSNRTPTTCHRIWT